MTKIDPQLEETLAAHKRKKTAVIITTKEDVTPPCQHQRLMDGIFSAKISYKQLKNLEKDAGILAVELDSEMDAI
ncbi:MAG: hypothetical protein WAT92_08885 [Saprospiraceae bacterium]